MNKYLQTGIGILVGLKLLQILISILVVLGLIYLVGETNQRQLNKEKAIINSGMIATSHVLDNGGTLPVEHTCEGDGTPLPLRIGNIPTNAKYLAVTFSDYDAGAALVHHWVVWNIPVQNNRVEIPYVPPGSIIGVNAFGEEGYTPPCHDAPNGEAHKYVFSIRALSDPISLDKPTDSSKLWRYYNNLTVGKTEFTTFY